MAPLISRYQAQKILAAEKAHEKTVKTSLDLGRTESHIRLEDGNVLFPDGQKLPLRIIEKISKDPICSLVEGNTAYRLQFFLPETNRIYRLLATGLKTPPTAEVSGFRMHRVKNTNPWDDTLEKIKTVSPLYGRVLDTCTGLGYTAQAAAHAGAEEVITVEVDPGMIRLREINPWSEGLCDERITMITGDIKEEITGYKNEHFQAIIHDPPTLKIAGELYSRQFYDQLHRVLSEGGRLFHYVGAPGSRYRGKNTPVSVLKRLQQAGFQDVRENKKALGVTAKK